MEIFILVGTRPNFIKVTQFRNCAALLYPEMKISIIHTGQHYDAKMTDVFFRQFNLLPDYYLNIGTGSPNRQTAEIMLKLEDLVNLHGKPDLFLVVGDVNSTLAGSIFANKYAIKLGHIEAGLRSFDRLMPEEANRTITDYLADLYFITERSGIKNLKDEGRNISAMHFVGNTMIDSMIAYQSDIEASDIIETLGLNDDKFVLMTMHRPGNVDSVAQFSKLLSIIEFISRKYKVVFPIHPRTVKTVKGFGLYDSLIKNEKLICTEPLDYFSFQKLTKKCFFVLTDSGGIQEETTFLQKPCLTLRTNTERPVTILEGTNTLLDFDMAVIANSMKEIEAGTYKTGVVPELWDGKATERILKVISTLA